ncbi:hypothetical protein C8J57DRAFT_1570459 [Mycena rebaudengoi]|nr:hypothetical protein C8J57DRAFT_1570459 [Mycena rebaudengoi]
MKTKRHSPPRNAAGGTAPASVAPLSSSALRWGATTPALGFSRVLAFRRSGAQHGIARVSAPRGLATEGVGDVVAVDVGAADGAADAADDAGGVVPVDAGSADAVTSRSTSRAGVRHARASARVPTAGSGFVGVGVPDGGVPRPRPPSVAHLLHPPPSPWAQRSSARPPSARSISAANAGEELRAHEGGGGEKAHGEVEAAQGGENRGGVGNGSGRGTEGRGKEGQEKEGRGFLTPPTRPRDERKTGRRMSIRRAPMHRTTAMRSSRTLRRGPPGVSDEDALHASRVGRQRLRAKGRDGGRMVDEGRGKVGREKARVWQAARGKKEGRDSPSTSHRKSSARTPSAGHDGDVEAAASGVPVVVHTQVRREHRQDSVQDCAVQVRQVEYGAAGVLLVALVQVQKFPEPEPQVQFKVRWKNATWETRFYRITCSQFPWNIPIVGGGNVTFAKLLPTHHQRATHKLRASPRVQLHNNAETSKTGVKCRLESAPGPCKAPRVDEPGPADSSDTESDTAFDATATDPATEVTSFALEGYHQGLLR